MGSKLTSHYFEIPEADAKIMALHLSDLVHSKDKMAGVWVDPLNPKYSILYPMPPGFLNGIFAMFCLAISAAVSSFAKPQPFPNSGG